MGIKTEANFVVKRKKVILFFSECVTKPFIEMADWEKKCAQLYDYSVHATGLDVKD